MGWPFCWLGGFFHHLAGWFALKKCGENGKAKLGDADNLGRQMVMRGPKAHGKARCNTNQARQAHVHGKSCSLYRNGRGHGQPFC